MANDKQRRQRFLYFLLLAVPLSCSSTSFSPSWRFIANVKSIDRGDSATASSRRSRVNFDSLYRRSHDDLEPDHDHDVDDCFHSDDDLNHGSLLLNNESNLSSTALTLSRGGNANPRTRTSNPFANIRGRLPQKKTSTRNNKQSQLQTLQSLQRQKLLLFHKTFRKKQRQFQNSLYTLNSRTNPHFPRPPYTLWRIEPNTPPIGKTTLTGKIFLFNIAAFALQTIYPNLTSWGAKRSDLLLEGRQLHRLITPIFLHGGIGHLMANSYSLKSMGMNVERSFGPVRFLVTYFVSGVMGNVVSAIQSPNPAVGASGAIFGLVGAYYTFLSRNQELFGYAGQMQKSALLETIGMNLLLGMTNPMIDNWGHIGGFIGGVGMSYLIGPKLYVARVPAGEDTLDAGGFGMGRVVIDRPTLAFRMPEVLDEAYVVIREGVRDLGMRISSAASGMLNPGRDTHLFLDRTGNGIEKESVYKLVKGKDIGAVTQLPDKAHVTPMDGLRQNVSELDPVVSKEIMRGRRRTMPKPGRSLRPRYGHLYR
ncbi:hypothetical protein HJC23_012615 [Cyclotella cryptica]|uniref:Peptidase S54 rhomboid domain-containing protein n=1 Tax=Cyclotella cryptica TaxID=29204 RepID=A0ABD3QLN1_9STRA|eukprot:CCRYP_004144-RA/>CCRYP_004144-RA protein AED:0.00 eAED:0.00 QI:281/-1/1/1/-1/1/1/128/534